MGNPTYITYSEESGDIAVAYFNYNVGNSGTAADTSSLRISFFGEQNIIEYL